MSRNASDLAEFATVNLHYALAELTSIGDDQSIARALDHIRQAGDCLQTVMAECGIAPIEREAEVEAA